MDDATLLGCCGAYCKTCRAFGDGACRGCTIGYDDGSRDLSRARCVMKICCIGKGYVSCADCPDLGSCERLQAFFAKKGYKYGKYREALMFIRKHGYERFFSIANGWRMQYGKYE
ncbi:MAG: DUF3795 domain-containing protein [Spirochaetes bacterium]|nr:DUF3795 domain-containing protein [Spirochaetota bacterium]